MGRILQILIPIVLLTAAVAGCIGGDDEPSNNMPDPGDDNGDGNQTADNQTGDPPPLPVPKIGVKMAFVGNDSQDPPFIAPQGSELEFFLDGSESTIENGTIDRYAWSVLRPRGGEEQGTSDGDEPTFSFIVNSTDSQTDYGVYTATLRAMSDQGQLGEVTTQFALSYSNTFTKDNIMVGPSPTGCDSPNQEPDGSDVGGSGVSHGTYRTHSVTVSENATSLNMTLEFESDDPTANVKLYLFGPEGDKEDCGDAIAEGDAGESPVTLEASELAGPGSYSIRVQLVGFFLGAYTMDGTVLYEVPGDAGDEGDDGGDE